MYTSIIPQSVCKLCRHPRSRLLCMDSCAEGRELLATVCTEGLVGGFTSLLPAFFDAVACSRSPSLILLNAVSDYGFEYVSRVWSGPLLPLVEWAQAQEREGSEGEFADIQSKHTCVSTMIHTLVRHTWEVVVTLTLSVRLVGSDEEGRGMAAPGMACTVCPKRYRDRKVSKVH